MSQLNKEMALLCAKEFVIQKENPIGRGSGFNSYYIRVGQDLSHEPDSIYALSLAYPELEIVCDEQAKKVFWNLAGVELEFLIKVMVSYHEKVVSSKILIDRFK